MPVVNTNTIKEWFRTLKKPTEAQFWAWLDSFRHKLEKVPLDDVESLTEVLQKKADLVDGVVPVHQLPFSVKTSEVIALGNVAVEGANANLAVHSSGANAVRVNGVIRERTFPNAFPFTPLSFGSVKVLRGYALNDPALFYMAEGEELDEYKEPEIPDTALEIFKITLTPAGAIIDILSQIGGFKPKESDAWKSVLLTNDAATFLQHTVEASTYELNVSGAVSAPKICGLITKQGKYMWGGKPLLFYNNSGLPVQLLPAESIPVNPNAKYIPFAPGTSHIIRPGEYVLIKEKADKLIVVKLGGSASFPEAGSNMDVLVKDSAADGGVKWSNRLTTAETNITNKLDKPTDDGTWMLQKLGSAFTWVAGVVQNIANTDLSNISARIFTQGNTFTWNTAGFFHYLKGLLDKTGQGAFSKVVVVHPTTGEMVTRDFADPQATTLAVQNASTFQKTTMRIALLGTAVPANPVINDVSRSFIPVDTFTYTDIFGINLTMLDPAYIYIVNPNDNSKLLASNFYNKSNQAVTVLWNIPSSIPDGIYPIKIQNASTVQGMSNGSLTVLRTVNNTWKPTNWIKHLRINPSTGVEYTDTAGTGWSTDKLSGQIYNANIADANSGTTNDTVGIVAIKSDNFLLAGKDWEFRFTLRNILAYGGTTPFPFIGVTDLSNSQFNNLTDLVVQQNYLRRKNIGEFVSESLAGVNAGNNNPNYVIFTKKGTNLYIKAYKDDINGVSIIYNQWIGTLDNSKDYAIWMKLYAQVNTGLQFSFDYCLNTY